MMPHFKVFAGCRPGGIEAMVRQTVGLLGRAFVITGGGAAVGSPFRDLQVKPHTLACIKKKAHSSPAASDVAHDGSSLATIASSQSASFGGMRSFDDWSSKTRSMSMCCLAQGNEA